MRYYVNNILGSTKEISKSTFYRIKNKYKNWITITKDGNNRKVKVIKICQNGL